MPSKINLRKNWISSLELLTKRPVVMLPFFIIAFFETLALELIFFSNRAPLSYILNPIIKKFFGETSLHYPYNLMALPKIFYYAQIFIYIFAGVLLTAIAVNIFKNIEEGLPLRRNAAIKNALNKYFSFALYGVLMIVLLFLFQRVNEICLRKFMQFGLKYLPQISARFYSVSSIFFLFLANIFLQVFFIMVIPIMVIGKKSLLKAVGESIVSGFRNFFYTFILILAPFLVYLPINFLKAFSTDLVSKVFPELVIYVLGLGIIISAFVECFVIVCASRFLLEKRID